MKKIFFLLFPALSVMNYKDDFNVNNLPDTGPKSVIYCMPSTSDTTYITVSRSIPSKRYNTAEKSVMTDDIVINYQLNGQARTVTTLGNGRYHVARQQKTDDKVQLRVKTQNLGTVGSSTEVPQPIGTDNIATRMVRMKKNPSADIEGFPQLQATFTDPAQIHDYYAMRTKSKKLRYLYIAHLRSMGGYVQEVMSYYSYADYMKGRKSNSYDSIAVRYDLETAYIPISTASEPLLNPLSDTDDDFDFSNDFYEQLHVFDDATINDKTYTLRPNVEPYTGTKDETKTSLAELKTEYGIEEELQLEFYYIAPAYYHFLQALNDVSSGSLAQAGLSTIRITHSNVLNGIGICAGFNMSIKKH